MTDEEALGPIPRPCTATGCWRLVTSRSGRCEVHPKPKRPKDQRTSDARRGSAAARGYDSRWRKLRNRFIREHPLCIHCKAEGRTKEAEEVDHIIPLRQGGARLDPANLQSLCRRCHQRKTARETLRHYKEN